MARLERCARSAHVAVDEGLRRPGQPARARAHHAARAADEIDSRGNKIADLTANLAQVEERLQELVTKAAEDDLADEYSLKYDDLFDMFKAALRNNTTSTLDHDIEMRQMKQRLKEEKTELQDVKKELRTLQEAMGESARASAEAIQAVKSDAVDAAKAHEADAWWAWALWGCAVLWFPLGQAFHWA